MNFPERTSQSPIANLANHPGPAQPPARPCRRQTGKPGPVRPPMEGGDGGRCRNDLLQSQTGNKREAKNRKSPRKERDRERQRWERRKG